MRPALLYTHFLVLSIVFYLVNSDKINVKNNNVETTNKINKKFIGRIEHGKVKVLRRKEKISEEKFCEEDDDFCDNDSSSEEVLSDKKKIKYSIKFRHEKIKKNNNKDTNEARIMRLHKNERKNKFGKFLDIDDEDSSDEDDHKPLKRLKYLEDDD